MTLKTNDKNRRETNIELLRIISMFFVLLVHYNRPMNGELGIEMLHTSLPKFIGCASLNSLDMVCVNGFIIISGYFGIKWKLKGLLKFLFQISFWGGCVYLISTLIGFHGFQLVALLKQMTLFLFGVNWFFVAYLGLYLLAPILNAFVEKTNEKQLGYFLIAFYGFQTLFGWMTSEAADIHAGMSTFSFVGIYLLGAYLRKSSLKVFQWKASTNLLMFLGIGVVEVLISLVAFGVGFDHSIYGYVSPFVIVQTIYLFLFCKALTIKKGEKIILFFSSSAFAALLMHSWNDGSALYYGGLNWIYDHLNLPFLGALAFIVLFFAIACCIDKIRLWLWNLLSSLSIFCPSNNPH